MLQPSPSRLAFQLTFEGAWPTCVAFLGDGRRLAAANQNGDIFVWELPENPPELSEADKKANGEFKREAPNVPPVRKLVGHAGCVTRMMATRDGQALYSAGYDRTVRLWNPAGPASGKTSAVLDVESREREFKRNKKQEVLDAPGIELETVAPLHTFSGHGDWVRALHLSRDEKRLLTGDDAGTSIVWQLTERKELSRFQATAPNWVVATALSPDGAFALISEFRRKGGDHEPYPPEVRIWNVSTKAVQVDPFAVQFPKESDRKNVYVHGKYICEGLVAADFSPDGKFVALGQGGETGTAKAHIIEVETGKTVRSIGGHEYGVTDLRFSNDGQYLVTAGRDTTVRVLKVADGQEAAALGKPRGGQFKDWIAGLAISPDERWIAGADIAGLVHVWKVGD